MRLMPGLSWQVRRDPDDEDSARAGTPARVAAGEVPSSSSWSSWPAVEDAPFEGCAGMVSEDDIGHRTSEHGHMSLRRRDRGIRAGKVYGDDRGGRLLPRPGPSLLIES